MTLDIQLLSTLQTLRTLQTITMQLKQKISNILKLYPEIEFAYLYGSYAKGFETPLSDVDIAVYNNNTDKDYELRMFEFELEDKLEHSITGYKFDVRSVNSAPLMVVNKILTEGMLLFYRNERFYYDYFVNNRIKYLDFSIIYKPMFEQRYKDLINDR